MSANHLQLEISGMSCGSCVAHVRSALEQLPGVRVETVQVGGAVVAVAPTIGEATIRQAIADAGYVLTSVRASSAPSHDARPVVPEASGGCCCGGSHAHTTSSSVPLQRPTARRHR